MKPIFSRKTIVILFAFIGLKSWSASLCDGLESTQNHFQEVELLTETEQAPNQFEVTSCNSNALFSNRPACARSDRYGMKNGRYGSCVTYSAFSFATALAKKLQIQLPTELTYSSHNLVRIYDTYGNPWDTLRPGVGSFPYVLNKIANEISNLPNLTQYQSKKLSQTLRSIEYVGVEENELGQFDSESVQTILSKIASEFSRQRSDLDRLPMELIFDGWVLDRNESSYCPIRNEYGQCDTNGSDYRSAHSALIVGRQKFNGSCYVEIRNSWKACQSGKYGLSDNNCFSENDFVWITESALVKSMSGIRVLNSI